MQRTKSDNPSPRHNTKRDSQSSRKRSSSTPTISDNNGVQSLMLSEVKGMNIKELEEMARSFLYLLITQGFFAGLVIGKISEGNVRSGLKHSFVLVALALLISTGANVFLG